MNENASNLFGTGLYERRWERFAVDRQGMLMAVGHHLAAKTWRCKLIDISRGGVSVIVTTTIGLPLHYYLCIVGLEERIGCAEVYRNNNRIGIQFLREIDEALLHTIIRAGYLTGGGNAGRARQPATHENDGDLWIEPGTILA